jgi:hypothetical protein
VKDFWLFLVDNVEASTMKIDQYTMEALQLKAPGISSREAREVHGLVASGQVFVQFDQHERTAIWTRLRSFRRVVPSLLTFFEDFKLLECCAQSPKRLFPVREETFIFHSTKQTPTIRSTKKSHQTVSSESSTTCVIQTSESAFQVRSRDRVGYLDPEYRQMWLYAMRHYPEMPPEPKRDSRWAKAETKRADGCAV